MLRAIAGTGLMGFLYVPACLADIDLVSVYSLGTFLKQYEMRKYCKLSSTLTYK
jgi:hypothetical protein